MGIEEGRDFSRFEMTVGGEEARRHGGKDRSPSSDRAAIAGGRGFKPRRRAGIDARQRESLREARSPGNRRLSMVPILCFQQLTGEINPVTVD